MTRDPAGLEDFLSEPAGQRVKDAGGILLSMTKYGHLNFLVDLGIGFFKGPTRELALERVAQVHKYRISGTITFSQ